MNQTVELPRQDLAAETESAFEAETAAQAPPAPRLRLWHRLAIGFVFVAIIAGLYQAGKAPRIHQNSVLALAAETRRTARPNVQIAYPERSSDEVELTLPGDIQPIEQTVIYPRTSGYLRKWYVDIGDSVTQGQLLAEIDTPEIDQQLEQALAKVEQLKARRLVAQTRLSLAQQALSRIEQLASSRVVTMQELEERQAEHSVTEHEIKVADADIAAGVADLQRIKELQSFARVRAPFSGTITERSIDLGQLVTSGNDQAQSLFRLARTNRVLVVVNIPQIYAANLQPDQAARLLLREMPRREIEGRVARTARSIDPRTRTMRIEVEVENDDGTLLPGTYAQVLLQARRSHSPLVIPASALIFNADGPKVAVVTPESTVELRRVEVAEDYGTTLGISTGIEQTDQIVTNPGDRLSEGMQVAITNKAPSLP